MSRSSPCDILLLTRKCCSENEEKALLLIRSRSVTDDLEQQLSARQGGSVCITSRWEPSRCSSPTWRGPLVCFSSWVSATPICWRSTANSYAQHSLSRAGAPRALDRQGAPWGAEPGRGRRHADP